jgi:hypothetical protein
MQTKKDLPNPPLALQSLVFNNPSLLGPSLSEKLAELSKDGIDLNCILEILECSDKDLSPGIANRRLREAGLFHGNPVDIHLTWRQYQRIAAEHSVEPIGGPVIYGLPTGQDQITFSGTAKEPITIPGPSCHAEDKLFYGTQKPDTFNGINSGSKVIFGGDADDEIISIKQTNLNEASYHYFAGNNGTDIYDLDVSNPKNAHIIYDNDHLGHLFFNSVPFCGIALPVTGKANEYEITIAERIYRLTQKKNKSVDELLLTADKQTTPVTIAQYRGGQC